ncbi:MAG: sugar phosphate isomerase/epimerase [Planctomycetales bacterium]
MKFAICNETFQDWPFERAFSFARDCGYTGIEIAPFTLAGDATEVSVAQRDQVRQQADAAGLQVIGLHWLLAKTEGYHLTTSDAGVRRRTADYLGHLARLCQDLGGSIMVFGSPPQRNLLPGVSLEEATDNAAEILTAAMPILEDHEVTLALEPLGPSETDFLTTAAEAVSLIQRIGSPACRLHLDVKAMSSEKEPVAEIIRKNARVMVHFHANDPNLQGPGFGQVDFLPIFEALGQVDYQGWVSVEVFDYEPGIERLASQSMEYMLGCLEQLREV